MVTYDFSKNYFKLPVAGFMGLSVVNSMVLYGTFIQPIFTPIVASFVCNPVFILPSLYLNFAMYKRYQVYFFGGRSHCHNMYLLPSGKQVIVETRDGNNKTINNVDFYKPKTLENRYEKRLDFYHGANNYLYLRGNPHIYDQFTLNAVLKGNFIDVNNVAFNFDVSSKDFTWDYKEMIEIKKRKRVVNRYFKPTAKVIAKVASA